MVTEDSPSETESALQNHRQHGGIISIINMAESPLIPRYMKKALADYTSLQYLRREAESVKGSWGSPWYFSSLSSQIFTRAASQV